MLVAAPSRWDEACFSVPAMRALIASGLQTGVLCRTEQREFWQTLEGLAVFDFSSAEKPKQVAREIAGNWQAALAWEPGTAAEALKIAGIPRRIGPDGKALAKLLTHPVIPAVSPLEHRVRHYLALVEALGIPTTRPDFFAAAALGIEPVVDAVLCCPGSDFGASHEWPIDRWQEIVSALLQSGHRVTIASVDGGRRLAEQLASKLGTAVESFHASPLGGTLPVLAVHGLVIAADGSLPHLAAHAGSTCLTLFGPNDSAWKRPLGKRHAVVKRHVECSPCLLPRCPLDLRCQNELETVRVLQAVAEKLAELRVVQS